MTAKYSAWILVIALTVLGGAALGAQAAGGDDGPGVLVTAVEKGSPAEKAGIARGDIVLAVDGRDVARANDLSQALSARKAGDAVTLRIRHGDAEKTVTVAVAERNGRPYVGLVVLPAAGPLGNLPRMFQMPLNPGFQAFTGSGASVANVLPGSPAEKAGLKAGDLIEAVDGVKVDPQKPLAELIGAKKPGDAVTLSVRSDGKESRDVKVTLGTNPQKDGAAWLGVEYVATGSNVQRGMPFGLGSIPSVQNGVIVNEVRKGSPADKAGMKARDIIVKIEGVPVASPDAVVAAVTHHGIGEELSFTVFRFNEDKETELKAVLGENPDQKGTAWLGISMGAYTGLERLQPEAGSGATPRQNPPQPNVPRGNNRRWAPGSGQPAAPRGSAA